MVEQIRGMLEAVGAWGKGSEKKTDVVSKEGIFQYFFHSIYNEFSLTEAPKLKLKVKNEI